MQRRGRFGEAILVIGTIAQILFQINGQKPLPFFILLAAYLFLWSFRKEGKLQEWYVKGSCLYSLAGVYIFAGSLTDNGVAVMMWVTAAYGAEYAVMCYRGQARTWFWDGAGLTVFLCTMAAFYWNPGLSVWNLIPCLASFAVFYVMFYRGGNMWFHLAAAIAVLPLPLAAALRYGWTENQACGFTGAAVLISGILFRYYRPILRQRENVPAAWVNHHDLGFLYSPSCVAAYQLCQSEEGKQAALQAADILMERYRENGHFIQAWGNVGDPKDYRLIIDCMLNIPLLYWKSRVTGDERYEKAAREHFITSCNNVVRDDASAYHTFYFDPETGEPVKGVTRQGYSDDSAWARGQAWGIYGIALNYRNSNIGEAFDLFKGMTNYFLNRLPQDNVCYWDLIFGDGSGQSRDSSAAAVAVCGMQEMCKYLPETDEDKEVYKYAMHTILRSLIENYANHSHKPGEALLLHGVYSWHSGKGIDVGNIWGDYYYVEALVRFLKDWKVWW